MQREGKEEAPSKAAKTGSGRWEPLALPKNSFNKPKPKTRGVHESDLDAPASGLGGFNRKHALDTYGWALVVLSCREHSRLNNVLPVCSSL